MLLLVASGEDQYLRDLAREALALRELQRVCLFELLREDLAAVEGPDQPTP